MCGPHLEPAIVMLKVPVAESAGGLAGADVFPGIEKVGRVGELFPFEGLEDEELGVDDGSEGGLGDDFLDGGVDVDRADVFYQGAVLHRLGRGGDHAP